jgi:pyruvate-ferredoxin/flavodoxin oxidoreductase
MAKGPEQQRLAVESGVWPLTRFDPRRPEAGEPALRLDSGPPKIKVADYTRNEGRFRRPDTQSPEAFARLGVLAQKNADQRYALHQHLAAIKAPEPAPKREPEPVEA